MSDETLVAICDQLIGSLESVPNHTVRDILQTQARLARSYALLCLQHEDNGDHERMTAAGQAAAAIIESVGEGLRAAGAFGISHGFSEN